jgi:hypothetical protein
VKRRYPEIEIDPNERWVKCATLCNYLDISDDTVARRATPWVEEHVPHKFRWKEMSLNEAAKPEKRYWFPDALAFLRQPNTSRRVKSLDVTPVFHV